MATVRQNFDSLFDFTWKTVEQTYRLGISKLYTTALPLIHDPYNNIFLIPCTANERPVRAQYKCLVPIYVFPEIKLRDVVISKTEL